MQKKDYSPGIDNVVEQCGKLIPALFMHIQKTAGTSIVNIARQYYGASVMSHGDFTGMTPESCKKTLFVSGHFGFSFAERIIASRYSFTFLRDPVERILSFYYFCRSRDPKELPIYKKAHDLDLVRFLHQAFDDELIRSRIHNSQVWRLASGPYSGNRVDDMPFDEMLDLAIEHLNMFSHIGFTESFDEDKKIILAGLDLPESNENIRANVTENRPVLSDLEVDVRDLLLELTKFDSKLYKYAWLRQLRNGGSLKAHEN